MLVFFRLPFVLLEMVLRQGVRGLAHALRLVRGDEAAERFAPTAAPPREPWDAPRRGGPAEQEAGAAGADPGFGASVREPAPAPPPTAEEALRRRREREAADRVAPPAGEPEPPVPLRAVEADDHVDAGEVLVESFGPAEDVHGDVTVDEPWQGYDAMPAAAVVARLRGSDEATRAVVRLYEQAHKRRQTVLRAAR